MTLTARTMTSQPQAGDFKMVQAPPLILLPLEETRGRLQLPMKHQPQLQTQLRHPQAQKMSQLKKKLRAKERVSTEKSW